MPGTSANTEWKLVTDAARDHLVNTPVPQDPLARVFPAEFVGELSLSTKSGENAVTLVERVRRRGFRDEPPLVITLLTTLLADPSFGSQQKADLVRRLLDRVRRNYEAELRRRAAAGDPFLVTILAGDEVFLDRLPLRESLRELHEGKRQKLLLQVTGDPATGKSYSARLIEHLAAQCGFHRARAFIEDETWTADEVIESLAMDVATTQARPPAREGDVGKWYGHASQWLVTKARERGGVWWFIVDGLNHLEPGSEVWELVQKLALKIDQFGEGQLRLLLLGYGGLFDHTLRKRYLSDRVERLTEADVREFFMAWLTGVNEHRPPAERLDAVDLEKEVEDTVRQVIEFATEQSKRPGGGCFMEELGRAIEGALDELDK